MDQPPAVRAHITHSKAQRATNIRVMAAQLKSAPAPAFVLARISAAGGAAWLPVSVSGRAEDSQGIDAVARLWCRRYRCSGAGPPPSGSSGSSSNLLTAMRLVVVVPERVPRPAHARKCLPPDGSDYRSSRGAGPTGSRVRDGHAPTAPHPATCKRRQVPFRYCRSTHPISSAR